MHYRETLKLIVRKVIEVSLFALKLCVGSLELFFCCLELFILLRKLGQLRLQVVDLFDLVLIVVNKRVEGINHIATFIFHDIEIFVSISHSIGKLGDTVLVLFKLQDKLTVLTLETLFFSL